MPRQVCREPRQYLILARSATLSEIELAPQPPPTAYCRATPALTSALPTVAALREICYESRHARPFRPECSRVMIALFLLLSAQAAPGASPPATQQSCVRAAGSEIVVCGTPSPQNA